MNDKITEIWAAWDNDKGIYPLIQGKEKWIFSNENKHYLYKGED